MLKVITIPSYYEIILQAKETLGAYVFNDQHDKPPSTQTQLGASLIAGFTATACSLPFDLLKSRMRKSFVIVVC